MKVKGIAILDLVKLLRSEKSIDWGKYLEPQDMEVLYSKIRPINWYPGDTFWRFTHVAAMHIGKMQDNNIIAFGRITARSYINLYKYLIREGDPAASIEGFLKVWNMFYDFEGAPFKNAELEKNPGSVKITAYDYPDMHLREMTRRPYFLGLAGYYQEIAEQALGKEVECNIKEKRDSFEITLNF